MIGSDRNIECNSILSLKLQAQNWELNVLMTEPELALIYSVQIANWNERSSVKIGQSAGNPAFWSCENGSLSILIGQDDESWDFGVTMPATIINDIIAEIKNYSLGKTT